MDMKKQAGLRLSRIQMVGLFKWHSNTRPVGIQLLYDHSSTRLAQYSDPRGIYSRQVSLCTGRKHSSLNKCAPGKNACPQPGLRWRHESKWVHNNQLKCVPLLKFQLLFEMVTVDDRRQDDDGRRQDDSTFGSRRFRRACKKNLKFKYSCTVGI